MYMHNISKKVDKIVIKVVKIWFLVFLQSIF